MPKMKKFNIKQEMFIKEYIAHGNASEAARNAGYSKKTAAQIGEELLRKPEIKAEINAGIKRRERRLSKKLSFFDITKERWLRDLAVVAFSNMDDYVKITSRGVVITKTEDRKRYLGKGIKKVSESTSQNGGSQSIELYNKLAALELIGKHMGWVKENIEHSGPGGGAIPNSITQLTPEELDARIAELTKKLNL